MGAQGHTTIDFGVFPGASDVSIFITGQAGILTSSDVEAWIRCEASADHSSDEHAIETIRVVAKDIVAGDKFTIMAMNTNQLNEPLEYVQPVPFNNITPTPARGGGIFPSVGGMGTRLYGVFNVSWCWN